MKKILTLAITLAMAATMQTTCFAAGWQQNDIGYWYENEDGTWPSNTWQWIDGNNDGKAECYYFNENGYMLSDTTTPDGYLVNPDGAWIENGVVQIQNVPITTVDTDNMTETERYARNVYELVNKERQEAGKSPLEWDDTLSACAAKRAEELVKTFSHSRPDKTSCFTIYREFNVTYQAAGENIAMGQTTPKRVMSSWMNSSGHKANILSDYFGKIGIGCYYADNTYYWVQMFTD